MASHQMCQTRAKAHTVDSPAMTTPAAVFFGMWIGRKPEVGRWAPRCFMSHHASLSCTTGVKAKLYTGGGEEVDHSRLRASQGSPVTSRSFSRLRKLTKMQTRKAAMPMATSTAPKAATWNQICSDGSVKWLMRRVTPIRPSTYSGVKANQ